MDDTYECDYCTATFGGITGLEEHIVDHLTINEEELQVFQDLIRYPERNEKGDKGKTPLSHEVNSSVEPCRSVNPLENENSVAPQRKSNLVEGSETKTTRRRSIKCCICGHALTKHPDIHTKMASKQVLMEHQCTGCSIFFETVESLENHCKDCNDFNNFLQKEVNFSVKASKNNSPRLSENRESANQVSKDGKLNNYLYKCGRCDRLCPDFNDWLAHEETHMNIQPFRCILCNAIMTHYVSYLEHIEKHRYADANTPNQSHISLKCKKCHKSFGNTWDLLMHDRRTHIDFYPFRCFACPKKYHTISSLRKHKKKCYFALHKEKLRQNLGHGEVSKRETVFNQAVLKFQAIFCEEKKLGEDVLCPVCKKKEGSFPSLTHHFAGHFGFLQCIYCNEPFKKKITLESQMPCNSKQFACQQCQSSKDTEILPDLVRKRKKKGKKYDPERYRMNPKKYQKIMMLCDTCGVTIKGRRQFIKHIETHNKPSCTDTNIHCPKCNALCESQVQLNMHLKRHHATSSQIQCKFCQRMLSSKNSLNSHISRCHSEKEAKFQCFECKKKFVLKSELIKHSNIHIMSDSKPYKCDQCEAAFAQNCNLTKHKIIHTGERPYKCDKCDAAFAHRSNLNKHSHIHTGKYSFRCNICNRGFDGMKPLTLHKKTHYSLSQYLK